MNEKVIPVEQVSQNFSHTVDALSAPTVFGLERELSTGELFKKCTVSLLNLMFFMIFTTMQFREF